MQGDTRLLVVDLPTSAVQYKGAVEVATNNNSLILLLYQDIRKLMLDEGLRDQRRRQHQLYLILFVRSN